MWSKVTEYTVKTSQKLANSFLVQRSCTKVHCHERALYFKSIFLFSSFHHIPCRTTHREAEGQHGATAMRLLLTSLLLLLNPHCAHPEYITSSEVNLVAQGTHEFIMHTVPETNMTFLHSVTVEWKTLGACTGLGLTADVVSGEYHATQTFETDTKMALGLQWDMGENDSVVVTVSDLSCDAAVFIAGNVYLRHAEMDAVITATGADEDYVASILPDAAMVMSLKIAPKGICPPLSTYTATVKMTNPYFEQNYTITDALKPEAFFEIAALYVPDAEGDTKITITKLDGACVLHRDQDISLTCIGVSVPETPTPKDTAVPYTYAPWVIRPQGEPRLKVWVYVAVGVGAVVVGFAAVCYCSRRVDVEGQYSEGV